MDPKVLVISNECFSQMSSNGRTLGNFFVGWDKKRLAQFFLTGNPDNYYCEHYFRVSDRHALNSLLGRTNRGGVVQPEETALTSQSKKKEQKAARNALTMLGRNLIWKSRRWEKSGYWQWVAEFQPDIVLLQAGDCAFMFDIAVETCKREKAQLMIYNSEGYYYKEFDYFRGKGLAHAAYPLFRKILRKSLERSYAMTSCVVYICDELKEQYANDFSVRAETVFTGTEIRYEEKKKENAVFTTAYCGNLGLKRHESLIEIAEALQEISDDLVVDVYGRAPNEEVKTALKSCKGIRFHGLVSYERVKDIHRESDLLLYVESFDEFYQEDIKFGFSTKIADSLSSGNCFLVYAPEHFACCRYLKNNQAAYTVSDKESLRVVLRHLVEDKEWRTRYKAAALGLAEKNHRIKESTKRFQELIREVAIRGSQNEGITG